MIRHSRYSVKRRSTTALAYSYCLASKMMDGSISVAAFCTATPAVTALLRDPSLLGEGVPPGDTYDVVDPGASAGQHDDGSAIIAQVQRMGREDTKRAIDRASAALGGWKDGTTALHRSGILSKWSELIKENTQDIAKISACTSYILCFSLLHVDSHIALFAVLRSCKKKTFTPLFSARILNP